MILAAYIVPALFVLARFRKVILSSRGALAFFALGLGLFVVAGAFDVIGVGIDELVEPLSAACIVGGFTRIALGSRGSCCATEPCDPNSVQPLHRIPIQPSQAQSMNRRVPKLRQEVRALPVVQHSGNVVKVS